MTAYRAYRKYIRVGNSFHLAVARDEIQGESSINKFGRNIEIDSGVTADIWDGGHTLVSGGVSLIWVAPTLARIHTIASTSGSDILGGTGATTVKIYYLPDWDTKEATEIVSGNLNSGIAMSNAAVIIYRMRVIPQASSTSTNVGVITATAAVNSTVTALIRAGKGQTQMAIYGIPSTQRAYMGRFYANINKSGGNAALVDIELLINPAPNVSLLTFLTRHTFGLGTVGTSAFSIPYYTPKIIEGPAIIKIQALSSADNSDVSAGFDLIVVDK